MSVRIHSNYTQDAVRLLGQLITVARKQKKMTIAELAERASISRGTLTKIEKGCLTCEIGIVFEVAMIVGIELFKVNPALLHQKSKEISEKLALLPERIRKIDEDVEDDF